ncbi:MULTISPECIES: HPr family phosphocarrier protein [Anaerotruncus]|uniref:HPr family phosphocarrier protein n=1 Tax=Anaerotruncus TaxID=244127 RepID=UPI001314DE59|nr:MULTISPECIES: HPr family phosphocarrier protein [Anaerotruncus]
MINENIKTTAYLIRSPYDLYGRNAQRFHSKVHELGGVILIGKPEENRTCRADSLLGILSLGVHKGDTIELVVRADSGVRAAEALWEISESL